jgi:hypothetical protein
MATREQLPESYEVAFRDWIKQLKATAALRNPKRRAERDEARRTLASLEANGITSPARPLMICMERRL